MLPLAPFIMGGDPIGLFEAFGSSNQTLARNLQDQVLE
jgi:hypothetical protein